MFARRRFRVAQLFSMMLGLAAASIWSAPALAVLIVNDTWQDGTRTDPASPTYSENGTDSDSDGDIESAWYRSGTSSTTTMSTGHMIHTPGTGSMSLTTYSTPEASPVTLSNVGDQVAVRWVFTPAGVTTTSTSNSDMRLGFVDSPSASRVTSDATPGASNYTGYGVFFNMNAGTLGSSNAFRIMERNFTTTPGDLSDNLLSSNGAWTQRAAVGGTTTAGYTSGVQYTLDLSLTKTASGVDVIATMSGTGLNTTGTLTVSFSDTTPQTLTFDTFAIRPQTAALTATSFDTTLFRVEFTAAAIPEASSFLLVGLVGVGSWLVRRLSRGKTV